MKIKHFIYPILFCSGILFLSSCIFKKQDHHENLNGKAGQAEPEPAQSAKDAFIWENLHRNASLSDQNQTVKKQLPDSTETGISAREFGQFKAGNRGN